MKIYARSILLTPVVTLLLTACEQAPQQSVDRNKALVKQVVQTNADIAYANYQDSLTLAQQMRDTLAEFITTPDEATFAQAKQAWINAREPYGQTEVFRFRGGPIDVIRQDGTMGSEGDGPEGRLNAWPLGEAIIDYVAPQVDGDAGPESPANVLQNNIIADTENVPVINTSVLQALFEHGEDERNVTTGYHAIEFLLWGQDLNQDQGVSFERDNTPGQRPVSDFFGTEVDGTSQCTSGQVPAEIDICKRRGDYLLAAADLLIDDLKLIADAWKPNTGQHYKHFISAPETSLAKILEGMGRLSFGELAGERINIALSTDSQEDEHSCFSDNTHRDILLNALGIQNVFLGSYTKSNGERLTGTSVYQLLVQEGHQELAEELKLHLEKTMAAVTALDVQAKEGKPFDVLIQQGVNQPEISTIIRNLVAQTDVIERAITALNLKTGELHQDTEQDLGV